MAKKYQFGIGSIFGAASKALPGATAAGATNAFPNRNKLDSFMSGANGGINGSGISGGDVAGALTSVVGAFRKPPSQDPGHVNKPYKNGSKLIKYDKGTDSTKTKKSAFRDPDIDKILQIAQGGTASMSAPTQELAPLETLRAGSVTPTIEETNKQLIKMAGDVPAEKSSYSASQSGILSSLSGLLKGASRYKGRGQKIINPIAQVGSKLLPYGVAGINYFQNKSEQAGEKITDWKNAALQTASDLIGVAAGKKIARGTLSPFLRKSEDIKKVKEQVDTYKEAKKLHPEKLITWGKELSDAKAKDKAMTTNERLARQQDVNAGKIKYLSNEAEVLANKPKTPSLKDAQLSKPLMERFKESAKREGSLLKKDLGVGGFYDYIKGLSNLKKDEDLIRKAQGKSKGKVVTKPSMSRENINEIITGAGIGTSLAGAGLGTGYLINRALSKKNEGKNKKSNK